MKVSPAELEGLLMEHPCVAEAVVIGVKDDEAVELVRAYIVLTPGKTTTEVDIKSYVAGKMNSIHSAIY